MGLLLGSAKIDITPEAPLALVGFGGREGFYESVSRRLYARVWYFRQEDGEADGQQDAVLVQGDLLWWGNQIVHSLRPRLMSLFGLDEASVFLHASHNHSGPDTGTGFGTSALKTDKAYVALLEEKVIQGIRAAVKHLEPITIERGHGQCAIGVNRRKRINDEVVMGPNLEGVTDPEVTVLRFLRPDGNLKGILFHFTCHPTTTMDNRISSEYPGAAMEALESKLGDGIAVSFLQGCCGDIRPGLIDEQGQFWKGSEREVDSLGEELAGVVMEVLETRMHPVRGGTMRKKRLTLELPLQQPTADVPHLGLELTYLRLAEDLGFLVMSGEMVVSYGLYAKARSRGAVLPMGYSNGMIGYVPTAQQLAEGGYESIGSIPFFGMPSPFAPELERMIQDGVDELMG